MKINKIEDGKNILICVEGSLSVENLSDFQQVINECLKEGRHVMLELSEVSFIDSSTLGVIVLFYTRMKAQDLDVVIVNVKPEIYQMLNLTGVSKKMMIFRCRESALDYLAGR